MDNLEIQRHSMAHVMAAAVQNLYPQAKFGIGPVIENGFYYDIDFSGCYRGASRQKAINLTPEDLPKIEKEMKKIIKADIKFEKREIGLSEAKKIFKNQPYKLELLEDIEKYGTTQALPQNVSENSGKKFSGKVTIYKTGDFIDLCRGPHVKSAGELSKLTVKLERIAGAYWRGNERNKMLTRIYGLVFKSESELKKYLEVLIEAKKRDHRKLGQELELFMFDDEVGPGLCLWLPKGALLRQQMERFVIEEYQKRGYQLVMTPHIASAKLFERSGHLGFYKDGMYSPMDIDGEDYYVKPMNCPMHVKIYKRQRRSYRELPLRYTELGTVYRYEKSGVLHGLTRVRGFTQDDAHIICTPSQLIGELIGVIELTKYILGVFGFNEFKVVLSVRDPKNKKKYLGSDKDWDLAENGLKNALGKSGWKYEIETGEAVFYGPKIDVKVYDSVGREWQLSTLQLDFNLPERFDMAYIDKNGQKKRPFMLHRALLGSLERFTGVLIEHYAGAFPLWLSPVQIVMITVGSAHIKYAQKLAEEFRALNLRVEVWDENETVANKIRKAEKQKIPYMLVIGDREMKSKNLHVRKRGSDKVEEIAKKKFMESIKKLVESKSQNL